VAVMQSEEVGLDAWLLPVVSADRQFVRLHLNLTDSWVDQTAVMDVDQRMSRIGKLTLDKTFVIRDGRTLVCRLGQGAVTTYDEVGPLGCQFVGIGRDTREVFLLVTTRVIVDEEAVETPVEQTESR
jgi:hypothetical protein